MSWLIRLQADDFFNAYKVLKESDDLMMSKLENLSGKPLVSKTAFGACPVSTPSIACLAFALELYIKNLYVLLKTLDGGNEKIKPPRVHNILQLFRKLPEEAQQEIKDFPSIQKMVAFYSMEMFPPYIPKDKNNKPISDVLERQIYKISDAFEKWRYPYENGALQFEESTALAFIEAVKSITDNAQKRAIA